MELLLLFIIIIIIIIAMFLYFACMYVFFSNQLVLAL
jgi:hypothetical protein